MVGGLYVARQTRKRTSERRGRENSPREREREFTLLRSLSHRQPMSFGEGREGVRRHSLKVHTLSSESIISFSLSLSLEKLPEENFASHFREMIFPVSLYRSRANSGVLSLKSYYDFGNYTHRRSYCNVIRCTSFISE